MAALAYPDPALTLGDLILRPFRSDDFDRAVEAAEDPSSVRWINPMPASDGAGTVAFIESERRVGRMLDLVIAEGGSDRYLGEVILMPREQQTAELAYVVCPDARGRGIATGAVDLLGRYAFSRLAIERLQLRVEPDNVASRRVAEKAGFRQEGVLRSAFVVRGRRCDIVLYSRLPRDA